MTTYHSILAPAPGRFSREEADAARTQRLRAHSKRAWNVYNGLIANGELDRCYGPLLAAHIFLTRGRPSHTVSQRAVAQHANLPHDRVKDQMHRLEALGMLSHQREGNRWRTTLLPFVPLEDAVRSLARARAWTEDQATTYLADLAERGVRLPWTIPTTAVGPTVADTAHVRGPGDTSVVQQLTEAITAFERGDLRAVYRHLDSAVRALPEVLEAPEHDRAHTCAWRSMPASPSDSVDQASRPTSPAGDPVLTPVLTPTTTPRRPRRAAQQHVDRPSLIRNRNPDRRSESVGTNIHAAAVPHPIDGGQASRSTDDRDTAQGDQTLRLLIAEGIYPANVNRFAALSPHVVRAAIAAANVPCGHPHRPGRIVERLEAFTRGLWRPLTPPADGHTETAAVPRVEAIQPRATATQTEQHDGQGMQVDTSAPVALWSALLDDLSREVASSEFDTWLSGTRLVDIVDDTVVLATANVFARDHITATYRGVIGRLLEQRVGRVLDVSLVIG